ncbi:unnamed protein product [Blepharisma stoltei]|uniref:USP domain-containing protein n=1 Tax=Blepharisma stoltei TaxID=1481888 RepID=A0AAU9IHP3_9CILI|nr:unnamed protein product [Blepharisma stoltei]
MKTERIEWPRILTIYISDRQILGEIPEMLNLENNSYQIFGVICYYGYHFIAFTKNDENEWEKYDDSEVSKKDPDWGRLFLAFYKKN